MSKELEAIKSLGEHHCSLMQKCESEECNIPCYECKYLKEEEIIKKGLKALEIIKEKEVQVAIFLLTNSCIGYNFSRGLLGKDLEQEEYDLLKEVLTNA